MSCQSCFPHFHYPYPPPARIAICLHDTYLGYMLRLVSIVASLVSCSPYHCLRLWLWLLNLLTLALLAELAKAWFWSYWRSHTLVCFFTWRSIVTSSFKTCKPDKTWVGSGLGYGVIGLLFSLETGSNVALPPFDLDSSWGYT